LFLEALDVLANGFEAWQSKHVKFTAADIWHPEQKCSSEFFSGKVPSAVG
jgi:hypothetical protein